MWYWLAPAVAGGVTLLVLTLSWRRITSAGRLAAIFALLQNAPWVLAVVVGYFYARDVYVGEMTADQNGRLVTPFFISGVILAVLFVVYAKALGIRSLAIAAMQLLFTLVFCLGLAMAAANSAI